MGPLNGIRVLEFTQIVAGPVAGLNLADLGADVIKVEPLTGDSHRYVGTTVPGESKMFQGNNRGKRGLSIDIQDRRGREIIHRLIATTDVVVINFRPGVPARLGIDYESVKRIRPDIIYAEISGFGIDGPGAKKAGSDIVAQAHSGLMAADAKVDEGGGPKAIAVPLSDYAAGLAVAMAVCAALYHRALTGEGQYVTTSLLRIGLHLQNRVVMREPVSDVTLRDPRLARLQQARAGGATFGDLVKMRESKAELASPFSLYYRSYQALDGSLVIGALTPQNRQALRTLLGLDGEHSDDPGFDAQLQENIVATERWKSHIEALMKSRPVDEWVALIEEVGVPVARVNFPEEMSDDPLVESDGIMLDMFHTITGPQRVVGPSVLMSNTPTGSLLPAPALGEHTFQVLSEVGVGEDELAALVSAGVIRGL